MTDSKFSAEYKDSVNDVIKTVVLPTDYKSKILSALKEQAQKTEAHNPESISENDEIKDTQTAEIPDTTQDTDEIIHIDSVKTKKKTYVKRTLGIISGVAAAIIIVVSVMLLRSNKTAPLPDTENLKFSVASATNLANISGAKVTFRNSKGEIIKNEDGTPVTAYTDEDGNVSVSLPQSDSYIAMISAEGYIPYEAKIHGSYIYLSPVMSENTYRAILTWESKCDLDAVLTVTRKDQKEQLFYFNSSIRDDNDEIIASLDTDSSTPGTPETITFNATEDGIFRLSVASYSALTTADTSDLGTSKAKVTLYKGDSIVDTFTIDPDTTDNTWCILEINNSELKIIDNTYSVNAIPEIH